VTNPTPSGDSYSQSDVYPQIWARRWSPTEEIGAGTLYVWAMMPGRDWWALGANMALLQSENNLIPLYADPVSKFSGLYFSGGKMAVFSPWSGDGKFWRDFGTAAVVVAASAYALTSIAASAGITPQVPGAVVASGIPAPAIEVATLAPLSQTVAPVVQTAATVGSGGFTLAQVGSAIGAGVSGVQAAAQAIVTTAGAVNVVRAAIDGQPNPGQPVQYGPPEPPAEKPANNSALLLAGLVALVGFLS
jgi:hypothetical protein